MGNPPLTVGHASRRVANSFVLGTRLGFSRAVLQGVRLYTLQGASQHCLRRWRQGHASAGTHWALAVAGLSPLPTVPQHRNHILNFPPALESAFCTLAYALDASKVPVGLFGNHSQIAEVVG